METAWSKLFYIRSISFWYFSFNSFSYWFSLKKKSLFPKKNEIQSIKLACYCGSFTWFLIIFTIYINCYVLYWFSNSSTNFFCKSWSILLLIWFLGVDKLSLNYWIVYYPKPLENNFNRYPWMNSSLLSLKIAYSTSNIFKFPNSRLNALFIG